MDFFSPKFIQLFLELCQNTSSVLKSYILHLTDCFVKFIVPSHDMLTRVHTGPHIQNMDNYFYFYHTILAPLLSSSTLCAHQFEY
jgi:hypothetical protein